MVVQLRQMHARADRLQHGPNLVQPLQAAVAHLQVPGWPDRCDPRLPGRVAMHERRGLDRHCSGGIPELLAGEASAGMGATPHQILQLRQQATPTLAVGRSEQTHHLAMQPGFR